MIGEAQPEVLMMKGLAATLWYGEQGQDLTEYALLLVLLSLAAMASLRAVATSVNNVFTNGANNMASASS